MDYIKGELESGFKFINPNEKADVGVANLFIYKKINETKSNLLVLSKDRSHKLSMPDL